MKNNLSRVAMLLVAAHVYSFAWTPFAAFAVYPESAETTAYTAAQPGRISMSFDDAPLNEVLKIFSQQSGLNFVSSQEAENKKITVYLENVPVDDALESLITANNLRYRQKEGSQIFIVYPADSETAELETRVFHLKYMRLSSSPLDVGGKKTINHLEKEAQVVSSSGSSSSSSNSSASAGSSGSRSSDSDENSGGSQGPSANAKGVDKLVANLMSKHGKISMNLGTNSLIVMDTPEKIKQIEKVLQEIDVPPTQVMLEVYLMEVKKTVLDDLGIKWGTQGTGFGVLTGGVRTTGFPFTSELLAGSNRGLGGSAGNITTVTSAGVTGAASAGTGFTRSMGAVGSLNMVGLNAALHYLTSNTDTKVLARPRILTLNNEAAEIKLVTNAAITDISETNVETDTTQDQAERAEIGISLRMTPQINEDQSVSLFLEPSVSTVAASALNSASFLDPTIRSIRTMARVQNHETMVIGGLIDSDKSTTVRKVPVLGDMPFLGNAFKYNDRDHVDRELLIFITPHIVDEGAVQANKTPPNNLAMKRMADQFRGDEMDLTMRPFERREDSKNRALISERERMAARGEPIAPVVVGPLVDKEMNKALESFNPSGRQRKYSSF